MSGDNYLTMWLLTVAAIVVGIIFFSIWGLNKTIRKNDSKKIIVITWILLTIPLMVIEGLQSLGALSGFLLFLYVVWIGIIKPTLR